MRHPSTPTSSSNSFRPLLRAVEHQRFGRGRRNSGAVPPPSQGQGSEAPPEDLNKNSTSSNGGDLIQMRHAGSG